MAYGVDWPGSNTSLGAPPGQEGHVQPLQVFRNGAVCVSCWELSDQELAEVNRTRRLYLSVFMGNTQPPVFVGGTEETRSVVADYGPVWRKE